MKIGASTYSLSKAIKAGAFDVLGAFDWIAENCGQHIEIVPIKDVFSFDTPLGPGAPGLAEAMVARARKVGIDISCYTFGASFINCTPEQFKAEVKRVKEQIKTLLRIFSMISFQVLLLPIRKREQRVLVV